MTEFHAPTTVDEAVDRLGSGHAVLVGGSTSLTPLLRERLLEPDALVWLGRVPELWGITTVDGGDLIVGATATLADLVGSATVRAGQPMLWAAAGAVGNPRVRAVATVGGAVAHADPRQDLLPALLVADATLTVAGPDGRRTVRLRDGFYRGLLETGLGDDEVIVSVRLPAADGHAEAYERFTPGSREDFPTVAVAVRVGADGSATVGLGGVASRPLLVTGPGRDVAGTARDAAAPIDDERGSAAYKRAMVEVITRRVLERLTN